MKSKLKKYLITGLKIVISFTIFIFVLKKVLGEESLNLMSIVTLPLIFVIVFTGIIQMVINSFIQFNLFLIYDYKFKFVKLMANNFISAMYLLVIPGFFAPDFYLGYVYGKEVNQYSRIISALFINRVIGFIKFFLFASVAVLIMGSSILEKLNWDIKSVNPLYLILFVIGSILLFFILKFFFKEKIIKLFTKAKQILRETGKGKEKIVSAFILKLLFNIVGISGRMAIGLLLGVDIPILELAAIIVILNFLIALPISFNGIGVREIGYVGLLTVYGVPSNVALSFALCEFGINLSASLIGFILWSGKYLSTLIKKYGRNLEI